MREWGQSIKMIHYESSLHETSQTATEPRKDSPPDRYKVNDQTIQPNNQHPSALLSCRPGSNRTNKKNVKQRQQHMDKLHITKTRMLQPTKNTNNQFYTNSTNSKMWLIRWNHAQFRPLLRRLWASKFWSSRHGGASHVTLPFHIRWAIASNETITAHQQLQQEQE